MLSHRQFITFSLVLTTVVAAAIAVPLTSRAAAPLVELPTSANGWHPIPVSADAARSDVTRRLRRGDRGLVRHASIQVAGARQGHAILRDEAFSLSSPGAAARLTRAWAGRRSSRVAVGRDGRIVLARGVASVIWREGARVGLLILRQRASAGALRSAAVADARFADAALRTRQLSDTWQRVLAGIDARGRVNRATALAAFSLAYGPLPGVRTPHGHHAPIPSGTLAALWALSYAPRLSAVQRAVIDRRLGVRTPGAARAAAVPGSGGDKEFVPNAYYQEVAGNWQAAYQSHLARPLGLKLVVGTSAETGTAFADALPLNADGEPGSGLPASCRIRMGPLGEASSSQFQLLVLAHEVFHCFQFALEGRNAWQRTPPWILEGMADWAALTVDPVPFEPVGAGGGGGNIKAYIETPQTELFARSYDAVGFWGHVADFTGPLWPRVSAILNAGSDVAAFKAAEGAEENVLSSWGSSAFRVSPIAGFAMHSPIEPPHFDQLQPEGLKAVWAHRVGAAPYTTRQYEILPLPHVPLIHVEIDGPARLLTGGTEDRDLQNAWFCVQGEDCRCPPDTAGSIPPTRPLDQPAYLGVTGDPDVGTAGVVESETLAQFCRPSRHKPGPHPHPRPRPAPGPLGCGAGCGSSNGDPHMHPFTADPYEFQAAGEFTLVRSNTGALEIQTRQQPWGHTRDLSINTAIAMRVGRSTVELDAGRAMGLIIDHRRRGLPKHTLALRGGGHLRVLAPLDSGSGNAVELAWPDGSRARVWPIESFGIAILFAPARSLSGKLTGLLGNLGGSSSAPFVGRDGRQYPADLITGGGPTSSAARYGAFGESWRVRQRGSLFTYPRGKTTKSYTVRGFPFDQYDLSGAPAAQRTQAEQLCRRAGVSDPAALADCVVDVLGTGDRRFAESSVALQRSAGRGTLRAVHPWTKLSSVDDSATDVRPSLTASGSGLTAAYRRDVDGAVELADLVPGVDGVALRARSVPLSGWTTISDPVVFQSAGGQTGLLVAGLHSDDSSDPLNGTSAFARSGPGAGLGAPTALSGAIADGLGAGAVLAADAATPLWSSTSGGQLAVHRGAAELDLPSPGLAVSSALAYDRSGELWLAWHAVGAGAADGIYMQRLDPATGAPAPGASPQHAPASDAGNVQPLLPLACAASCRVVYVDARGQGTHTLDSWSPGEAAPTAVARATGLRTPSAAYTADGRLWVTWVSSDGNRLFAKLGDARGVGGAAQLIPLPPGHDTPDTTTALASGERLVLASEFSALSADVNSVWATVVDPH